MNSQTFDWLEVLSAEYFQDGRLTLPRTEPCQNVLMLDLGVYWVPLSDDNSQGYYHCTNEAAEQLLDMCQEDTAAFDICKSIAAHRLAINCKFLPALQTFTALYMPEMIERPKSTRRIITSLRNMYFYKISKVTEVQFGRSLTRKDEDFTPIQLEGGKYVPCFTMTQKGEAMAYLNLNQFSQKLGGLSLSSLYRNIGSGLIPEPIRRGGRLYWIDRQVDEALTNQQQ